MVMMAMAVAPAASESACTPAGADLSNPTPMHFSNDAVDELERSYRAPEVRGLRTALETYLAGDSLARVRSLLKNTPQEILRKRFALMADVRGEFGGYFLTVQFKQHPEALYRAWVYDVGDDWDLRAWETIVCSAPQQRWLRVRYGELNLPVSG
jgi:hypothetical protein